MKNVQNQRLSLFSVRKVFYIVCLTIVRPIKGIFLPVKSGILGIGIRNSANHCKPEPKFH